VFLLPAIETVNFVRAIRTSLSAFRREFCHYAVPGRRLIYRSATGFFGLNNLAKCAIAALLIALSITLISSFVRISRDVMGPGNSASYYGFPLSFYEVVVADLVGTFHHYYILNAIGDFAVWFGISFALLTVFAFLSTRTRPRAVGITGKRNKTIRPFSPRKSRHLNTDARPLTWRLKLQIEFSSRARKAQSNCDCVSRQSSGARSVMFLSCVRGI
jgi:hypothetical protein